MAAFFDLHQYAWIKVMLFALILCVELKLFNCRKHKHAPVVAFFQGHCTYNICDQRCRDIDNGGYACECYEGYQINPDGISCTKIGHKGAHTDLDHPTVVKIIPSDIDTVINTKYNTLQSDFDNKLDSHNHVTYGESVLKPSLDNSIDHNSHSSENQHSKNIYSDKYLNKDTAHDESAETIKIVTYDGTPESPSLESENLRTSETSGTENLQNLVPNPLPVYSSASSSTSNEESSNKPSSSIGGEKCDEFSCLNNGECVDDGTVFRNKLRCDCKLGTIGDRCEKAVEVRYPRYYGNSYLALPVLKNGYKEIDLQIEFKPTAKFGLLFFSSEFEDARSDFISVSLINSYIEFRYDCGTGVGILRSESPVVMETWNTLRIYRQENEASLWLNKDLPINGTSPGSYSRLTLRLNLYIGGYDKIERIGDKVGTSKGFVGCVQQVVVNGYRYDLRKSDLVGDAQFGANIGECSEGLCDDVVCEHGGKCKVTSADSHVCLCPLGTVGESCQHVTNVHIPEFNQHSYLEFKGLGRTALLFLEIELVVKSTKPDGLILYNGYTLDRSGDFISLTLHDSYVEFRFDLGTGPAIIRSPRPITLNKWHRIRISRTGMEGILEIDDEMVAMGQSQGAFTQLTVTQSLYIGGHRNFDETSQHANVTQAFEGCIQKLTLNNRPMNMVHDAISGVNVESCEHPCIGQPCLHGGECIPKKDVYSCYCPLGYSENNCQKQVDRDIVNPKFTSESYLMYSQKNVAKRIGGDSFDIQFSMKPGSRDGLILWSGPNEMQATSDYIAVGLKGGALQFRYNLGSGEAIITYNDTSLHNGLWHKIHIRRDKQTGFLVVDGKEVVGKSKGSYTMLNTNKILYIGGMADVSHGTLNKFETGYTGCLQDVVLHEDYPLNLLNTADSGRNIVPCS